MEREIINATNARQFQFLLSELAQRFGLYVIMQVLDEETIK